MTWSAAEFEARLRRVGDERYHQLHPFHIRMHEGRLGRDEIRRWVRNRYYYQTRIPLKDAAILAKATDTGFRRAWVQRLHDHDGASPGEGGLALWLRLAEAVGLPRSEVEGLEGVLPGARAACDAYVAFVRDHDLLACVAASLTELFAGALMGDRIAAFEKHYPWVDAGGLRYFRERTRQAPRDAAFGLRFVLDEARTEADQSRCIAALERKCEILWQLAEAIDAAGRRLRLSRHVELRHEAERGQSVAVLPERAVRLNESGREILSLCDGVRSADAVALALRRRHPEARELVPDVHGFLERMEQLGVLELAG